MEGEKREMMQKDTAETCTRQIRYNGDMYIDGMIN